MPNNGSNRSKFMGATARRKRGTSHHVGAHASVCVFLKRNEARPEAEAERVIPGL